MGPLIGGILSSIGSIFGSILQTRQAKMEATALAIGKTIDLLKEANYSDAQIAQAVSAAVVAESQSESVIARNWRPIIMLGLGSMIVAWMWGYVPPNITNDMSPFMQECFDLFKIGLCGYVPARTLEKIAKIMMTPKVIDTVLSKLKQL